MLRTKLLAFAISSFFVGVAGTYGLNEELRLTKTDANQSALESFTVAEPDRHWKIREIAEFVGLGGRVPVVAESPTWVADLLEQWIEETDVDGFNLTYAVMPESYENIIDLLIPELQRRRVYKKNINPDRCVRSCLAKGPICRKPILDDEC